MDRHHRLPHHRHRLRRHSPPHVPPPQMVVHRNNLHFRPRINLLHCLRIRPHRLVVSFNLRKARDFRNRSMGRRQERWGSSGVSCLRCHDEYFRHCVGFNAGFQDRVHDTSVTPVDVGIPSGWDRDGMCHFPVCILGLL